MYGTKHGTTLKNHKNHKAAIHDIDNVWLDCPELGCEFKAKQKGDIKRHRAHVHDIGVTWHECIRRARSRCTEPTCTASA